jgi:hypothetical protein
VNPRHYGAAQALFDLEKAEKDADK